MAGLVVAALLVTGNPSAQEVRTVTDPSKTIYGERSPRAPRELDVFAFLIGKWEGRGRTRLPDGKVAEYPVAWVGRYILDGMAIADEGHAPSPDGTPFLGITLRQYDQSRKTWVIEFLNVSESFLRRQVHEGNGSVAVSGRTVTVTSESPGIIAANTTWCRTPTTGSIGWIRPTTVDGAGTRAPSSSPFHVNLARYLKFSITIRSSPTLTRRSYRIVRSSGDTSNPDGMPA